MCAGTRGTYSFIVCRLCRFPLRVRYMPRSISVGRPTEGAPTLPSSGCPPRVPGSEQQWCGSPALARIPAGRLHSPVGRRGLTLEKPGNGRGQDGEQKKISLSANPAREPVKGACVCEGQPLGPAPAESQTQLFVTGLSVAMAAPRGRRRKQVKKLLVQREERLCPPEWQAWLFLAQNRF